MGLSEEESAVEETRLLLGWAVQELTQHGARTEALGRFESSRRRLLVTTKPKMVPLGEVWRLGVVLLDAAGALYATGQVTRAVDPKWRQHIAESMEVRRAQRSAAWHGSFEAGQSVDFNAEPIELTASALRQATGPVVLRDGRVVVFWAPGTPPRPFDAYLRERVDLATHPPEGDGRS